VRVSMSSSTTRTVGDPYATVMPSLPPNQPNLMHPLASAIWETLERAQKLVTLNREAVP
jgi:hypothetical protein